MAESKPFTAKMELGSEVRNADPLTVKINTTANIGMTSSKYPTKFKTWVEGSWGEKPADADNYIYFSLRLLIHLFPLLNHTILNLLQPHRIMKLQDI